MNTVANEQMAVATEFPIKSEVPKRWWHWLLLYPGLAVAVLGAIPTYIEAFRSYSHDVPFGSSFNSEEQNRLWEKNFECAQKAHFVPITNKQNVEIASVVCESGDILLKGRLPDSELPQIRWVSWDDVASKKSHALLDIIKSANASEPARLVFAQAPTSVLCQHWVSPGRLLQRLATPEGCFDEIINTYNGLVISRRPAPCQPSC
jgi:hypothetical protein